MFSEVGVDLWVEAQYFSQEMRRIKRALSLKGKGTDETLSELAEQMSFDVNGKDNGESNLAFVCISFRLFAKLSIIDVRRTLDIQHFDSLRLYFYWL